MLLRNRRVALGLTQGEIAQRINMTGGHICHLETGRNPISPEKIALYAQAYELDVDEVRAAAEASLPMQEKHTFPAKMKTALAIDVLLQTLIAREDIEYLSRVFEGLQQSMTLQQVLDLLKLRKPLEPSPPYGGFFMQKF